MRGWIVRLRGAWLKSPVRWVDFAERIAQLTVDGVTVGYLQPRPIELYPRRRPPIQAIDLDVVLSNSDDQWTTIDFAIPDVAAFKQQASLGELHLNGRTYLPHWLDMAETARVRGVHFGT